MDSLRRASQRISSRHSPLVAQLGAAAHHGADAAALRASAATSDVVRTRYVPIESDGDDSDGDDELEAQLMRKYGIV